MLRLRPLELDTNRRALDGRFVPPAHRLRKLDVAVDLSFILDLAAERDDAAFARPAQHPERMGRLPVAQYVLNRSDASVCLAARGRLALRWFVRPRVREDPPPPTTLQTVCVPPARRRMRTPTGWATARPGPRPERPPCRRPTRRNRRPGQRRPRAPAHQGRITRATRAWSAACAGGERAESGAPDLSREERFTQQRRVDDGAGTPARELYYYGDPGGSGGVLAGGRPYLPGAAVFAQPDTVVPDPTNPQTLNRYAYAVNNPLRYTDPNGCAPKDWFNEDWKKEFRDARGGQEPTSNDYAYRSWTMAAASGMLEGLSGGKAGPGEQFRIPTTADGAPVDVGIDRNLETAMRLRALGQANGLAEDVAFAWLVRQGGAWDYKQYGNARYETFGNFNYGFAGAAAGYSQAELLRAAGAVQFLSDWRTNAERQRQNFETGSGPYVERLPYKAGGPGLAGPYYGDDPRDQAAIRLGFLFHQAYMAVR